MRCRGAPAKRRASSCGGTAVRPRRRSLTTRRHEGTAVRPRRGPYSASGQMPTRVARVQVGSSGKPRICGKEHPAPANHARRPTSGPWCGHRGSDQGFSCWPRATPICIWPIRGWEPTIRAQAPRPRGQAPTPRGEVPAARRPGPRPPRHQPATTGRATPPPATASRGGARHHPDLPVLLGVESADVVALVLDEAAGLGP